MSHSFQFGFFLLVGGLLVVATAPLLAELLLVSVAAVIPGSRREQEAGSALTLVRRLMTVVPSHNEQGSIRECVESIAVSAGGGENVLVIAHNCSDHTAEYARNAGAHVSVLNDPELPGKGNALAHGFALAFEQYGADAVLVVDADSRVSENMVPSIRSALGRSMVVQARYEARTGTLGAKARLHAFSFLCKNVVRAAGRQRLGLSCGIFGNGFGFRKEVLERVPYSAHSIVEDLEFHLSLLASGLPTRYVPGALVWAKVPESREGVRTQTARWEGGRVQMLRALGPGLLKQVFAGRVQLTEPLLDLVGLPLAIEVLFLILLLLLPVPFFRWYALAGLITILFHLVVGLGMSPDSAGTAYALLQAPWYIVKKVALTPAIVLMTRRKASWIKTSRAGAEK